MSCYPSAGGRFLVDDLSRAQSLSTEGALLRVEAASVPEMIEVLERSLDALQLLHAAGMTLTPEDGLQLLLTNDGELLEEDDDWLDELVDRLTDKDEDDDLDDEDLDDEDLDDEDLDDEDEGDR